MLKGLRFPILVLVVAFGLLIAAVYVRFIDEDEDNTLDNAPQATDIVSVSLTPTTVSLPMTEPTPVPTNPPLQQQPDRTPISSQLTEGLVGQISKLNPLFASLNPVDRDISALMFEGLTTINEFGEVVPALAERWGMSPDGLDYIFALRRDVQWHDGIAFTSTDVKYTIDVIRSSEFKGDRSLTDFWRTVEITVIDEFTLRFRLVQPLAIFPEYLRIGILPEHVLSDYPVYLLDQHPFNLDPIGTGPYQFENLLADRGRIAGVVLRAAPTYQARMAESTPSIDRLVFRIFDTPQAAIAAFVQGDVNSVGNVPASLLPELSNIPHLAIHTSLYPSVGMLIFNWQRDEIGYVRDQRARVALATALDRDQLLHNSAPSSVVPANSPLIPGSWAYTDQFTYPSANLDSARSLLQDVSFEGTITTGEETATPEAEASTDGDDPIPEADEDQTAESESDEPEKSVPTDETPQTIDFRRNIALMVLDRPELIAMAQGIAAQWEQIDFAVEVEKVDQATYQERLQKGDFDAAIVEYTFAPYADPDAYSFWHIGQVDDGLNYGGMRDLKISEILENARRETIGLNRTSFYREFQELFAERIPALPLYYPVYAYLVDDRLEGVQIGFISTPADRFRTIADWQWN